MCLEGERGVCAQTQHRHSISCFHTGTSPPPLHRKEALQQEVERWTSIVKEAADQQLVQMVDGNGGEEMEEEEEEGPA